MSRHSRGGSRGPSAPSNDEPEQKKLLGGEQDPVRDPMRRVRQERQTAATQISRSLKAWRAEATTEDGADAKPDNKKDEKKDGADAKKDGADAKQQGGDAGEQAKPQGAGIQVTVNMPVNSGSPISFDAPDYAALYQQVKARADSGQEAGSVTRNFDQACDSDPPTQVTFNIPLTVSLPTWAGYANAPPEHKQKYDAWYASVKAHEDQHVQIYKNEYAKLKEKVVGPSQDDAYTQGSAVDDGASAAQQAFDASTQPAPLAIPGGTEKVPADGDSAGGDGN